MGPMLHQQHLYLQSTLSTYLLLMYLTSTLFSNLLLCCAGIVNVSLSYSGPAGAFCAGETIADVLAQGVGCKAEVGTQSL